MFYAKFLFVTLIMIGLVWAKNSNNEASIFQVTSLNNPVKEDEAKFLLKLPNDLVATKVIYTAKGPKLTNLSKEITPVNGSQGSELRINVKTWKNGFYKMHFKIQDKNQKVYEYKSALKDYVSFSIFNPQNTVPQPDPKKNDSTLLGIDLDDNGIRDDIQNYILAKYKDKPWLLPAMHQYALAAQNSIKNANDKQLAIESGHANIAAINCIRGNYHAQGMGISDAIPEIEKLEALILNTKERMMAHKKIDEHFHGQSASMLGKEESCL